MRRSLPELKHSFHGPAVFGFLAALYSAAVSSLDVWDKLSGIWSWAVPIGGVVAAVSAWFGLARANKDAEVFKEKIFSEIQSNRDVTTAQLAAVAPQVRSIVEAALDGAVNRLLDGRAANRGNVAFQGGSKLQLTGTVFGGAARLLGELAVIQENPPITESEARAVAERLDVIGVTGNATIPSLRATGSVTVDD